MFGPVIRTPMGAARLRRKSTTAIDILIVMAIVLSGIFSVLVWRFVVV